MSLEDKQAAIKRAFKRVSAEAKDRYLEEAGTTELLAVSDKDIDELVASEIESQKEALQALIVGLRSEVQELIRKEVRARFDRWRADVLRSAKEAVEKNAAAIEQRFKADESNMLQCIVDEITTSVENEMSQKASADNLRLTDRKAEIKEAVQKQLASRGKSQQPTPTNEGEKRARPPAQGGGKCTKCGNCSEGVVFHRDICRSKGCEHHQTTDEYFDESKSQLEFTLNEICGDCEKEFEAALSCRPCCACPWDSSMVRATRIGVVCGKCYEPASKCECDERFDDERDCGDRLESRDTRIYPHAFCEDCYLARFPDGQDEEVLT